LWVALFTRIDLAVTTVRFESAVETAAIVVGGVAVVALLWAFEVTVAADGFLAARRRATVAGDVVAIVALFASCCV
jgi:hypothetical protein